MYDPTYPATNAEIDSAPLRNQFNALKALMEAIQTVTSAVVDDTATLPPGSPAVVSVTVTGNTLHFSFEVPQGPPGAPGEVTSAELAAATAGLQNDIQQCAINPSAVQTLDMTVSDPPAQWEVQLIAQKVDEIISSIKRV